MRPHLLYVIIFFLVKQLALYGQIGVKEYISAVGNQAIIYSGKEEVKYPSNLLNHPYLYTDAYKPGVLSFDGVVYPDVMMRLNLEREELVVLSPDKRFNIILQTDRVDYAVIEDKYFIFYNIPEQIIPELPKGFYIRLSNGKYPIFKRETCFLQSQINEYRIEGSFVMKNRLYIYKDGIYHTIANKRSLLKLFTSRKKELKRFIKDHKLDFKHALDASVVSVTEYYESISL